MNNLYNKIYEAVNAGIQKALIISDNQSDDVSIGWKEKEINQSFDTLLYQISEILAGNDILDNYETILNHYNNTKIPYKVRDIVELNQIYKAIKKVSSNIDLTWIDTTNALQIFSQYSENKKYSLHEYEKNEFYLCDFIKFGENIHMPLYIFRFDRLPSLDSYQWHSHQIKQQINDREWIFCNDECFTDESNISNNVDLNGYMHTYDNYNIDYTETLSVSEYPAIDTIINDIKIDNNTFKPYLPAINELMICSEYQDLLNYALCLMGNNDDLLILSDRNKKYWSSTEFNRFEAWCLNGKSINHEEKTNELYIFPLFKKIKG